MKPGYKTSEFWIAIITKLLAVFCVAGVITTADEQKLAATATNAVIGVFAIITAGKVIGEYIKGRSTVKSNFLPLVLLAVMLLPGIATAQPLTTHHSPLTRHTCLFGCRCGRGGGQADPQMMALLQQIAGQQQQILALLQQQHAPQSQPQQPMLIVLGGPQQQIPLGGVPRQEIPLGGPPRQDIPLGGPPRQDVPLGPAPKQDVPLGPAPKQQIPLGPEQPMPKAGATGYQRYSKAATYSWRPASRRE